VNGIRRDEFMIIPGFKVKMTYWLYRLTPTSLWNEFTDSLVSRALGKPLGK
jgi:hypothetical protein